MSAVVVNLRTSPWDAYIGRRSSCPRGFTGPGADGIYGNPIELKACNGNRDLCLASFRRYFEHRIETDPAYRAAVLALRGLRLGCFCHPLACHGNVYVEWLQSHQE